MAVHPTPDRKVKCSSHLVSIFLFAAASRCCFPYHGILSPQLKIGGATFKLAALSR
jgi:hypothetical protein